jgi:hypothetical protein
MAGVALAVRFGIELCALAALAYGGWRVDGPLWLRILLAVALPLLAAVVWGRWVAPRAPRKLADPLRLVPEWVVFGGATTALLLTGHPVLAALLAVVAAVDRLALWRLKTDTGGEPADR